LRHYTEGDGANETDQDKAAPPAAAAAPNFANPSSAGDHEDNPNDAGQSALETPGGGRVWRMEFVSS